MDESLLRPILNCATQSIHRIVVPRYQGKRGHPIYLPAWLINKVISLGDDETLRTVIVDYAHEITYVDVDSPDILSDIDTPSDYERPKARLDF